MAIPFIGSEALFTREGHIFQTENVICTDVGSDFDTRVALINNDFTSTDESVIDGLYSQRDTFRKSIATMMAYQQALSQATLIEMANDVLPLAPKDLPTAIDRLNQDLLDAGSGIEAPTLTLTVTAETNPANVGDTVLRVSKYQGDGNQVDYMFSETLLATVTADQGTGATAYQEPIQYVGELAVDVKAYNWPQGSGTSKSINIINGASTTKITNGNFATWDNPTTTMASSWTLMAGSTINVRVKRATTPVLPTSASYSCEFVGNGSTDIGIQQTLSVNQNPATVFGVNLWIRLASVPAAGVLRVRLVDGAGNVISDAQGVANSFTQDLTSGVPTSSWLAISEFFRLPKTIPSTGVLLEIATSTAISNGVSLYIAKVAMQQADQLYNGGWFVSAFSGGTPAQKGDSWSIAATNSKTTSSFVRTLDRNWGLRDLGKRIRTGAGISDSLIQ